MSTRHLAVGVIAVLLWSAPVTGQTARPASSPDSWQLEVTPYLWGSGVNGQLGIENHTADIDASFNNILSHLHFAAMGLADARRGKLLIVTDIMYTDLRGQRATPGPLFSSVNPQQKTVILTPEAGYRVLESDAASLDVVGGVRVWHLGSELQFQPGVLPGLDLQDGHTWFDFVAGARARQALPRNWWLTVYGDLGAGESIHTYQVIGTAGLDIHRRYMLVFGYRYLNVDYRQLVLLNTAMKGPLFGFTIKF